MKTRAMAASASSTTSVIYLPNALLQAAIVLISVDPRYDIRPQDPYSLRIIR